MSAKILQPAGGPSARFFDDSGGTFQELELGKSPYPLTIHIFFHPLLLKHCSGLDRRLLKAIARMNYVYPTLVQAKAIPLALSGKDLLIKAATGSGKTAAYGLALLQKILISKTAGETTGGTTFVKSLVLVPSKELVEQTYEILQSLSYYCSDLVTICALGSDSMAEQAGKLAIGPDVVVATPARAAAHLKAGNMKLASTFSESCTFVIDEADLVLNYGHENDTKTLVAALPRGTQAWLLSATLSPQLDNLKRIVLHSPVVLKLEDSPDAATLTQLYVNVPSTDRYLLLYALLRLKLIAGKTIIFTNSTNTSYKLKLFLDKFQIPSAVINAELPEKSRLSAINAFNKGMFDLLLATDEGVDEDDEDDDDESSETSSESENSEEESESSSGSESESDDNELRKSEADIMERLSQDQKRKRRHNHNNNEFSLARGVDFRAVTTVINFDFPESISSYTHRVGRTARGGASGVALSFVPMPNAYPDVDTLLEQLKKKLPPSAQGTPQPSLLPFDIKEMEGFRYRVESVMNSITPALIKAARLEELRREILASEALKAHFEENPRDVTLLQHATPITIRSDQRKRSQAHLTNLPAYLLPPSLKAALQAAGASTDIDMGQKSKRRRKNKSRQSGPSEGPMGHVQRAEADVYSRGSKGKGKSADPLRTFAYNTAKSNAAGMGK